MSLFGDIHEFLDHSCIGPFGTKWTLFQRENCDLQQVFLSKTNTVLIGKQWAGSSWFCHRCISYEKCICFLNLVDLGLFATKCAFLHLENCVCRKYSFKKLTEFSQRNQVVHAAANNTAVLFFFFGDLCASFTQLNRPIWNQWALLQLKKWFAKRFVSQN
jgi:hypothetical protein